MLDEENLSDNSLVERCPSDLLPFDNVDSFTLLADSFQAMMNQYQLTSNGIQPLVLHYSLRIGINLQVSSPVFLTVYVFGSDSANKVLTIDNILFYNGLNTWIDQERVRFYDDIVIAPSVVML